MAGCTVTYFDIAGRGFPVRFVLFHAFGKDGFVDERLKFEDWAARKPTTPLGYLPILTLADGTIVTQTDAIVRWAGSKGEKPLYPRDPDVALFVDQVGYLCQEVLFKCPQDKDAAEKKKKREEYSAVPDGPMYKVRFFG